ncbi:MAG: type II toxin-antitoxin system VapC family toxin [Spirochaetota bacterium]
MKKILLDTNAYARFFSGDENVLNVISRADIVYMSVIVLGELYYGFKGGSKESWNREIIRKFIDKPSVSVLGATTETSEIFAEIKDVLKINGTPIPINDVWIAAHSIETGSVLITYDRHFKKIPGLRIWDINMA